MSEVASLCSTTRWRHCDLGGTTAWCQAFGWYIQTVCFTHAWPLVILCWTVNSVYLSVWPAHTSNLIYNDINLSLYFNCIILPQCLNLQKFQVSETWFYNCVPSQDMMSPTWCHHGIDTEVHESVKTQHRMTTIDQTHSYAVKQWWLKCN